MAMLDGEEEASSNPIQLLSTLTLVRAQMGRAAGAGQRGSTNSTCC